MMYKASALIVVCALVLCLQVVPASSSQIISDFSVSGSVDGWSVFADNGGSPGSDNPKWVSGGYLSSYDFGYGYYWLIAPAKFSGNKSSFFGGLLSYNMKYDGVGSACAYLHPSVVITRGSLKLWKTMAAPGASYSNYTYTLNATGGWMIIDNSSWEQQNDWSSLSTAATNTDIAYILAAVDNIYIRGEASTQGGVNDAISVDDIYLSDATVASTPEPSSIISLLGGFGALGMLFRRARKH